jgi:coenzyme F420-0:L-glutamate ligase
MSDGAVQILPVVGIGEIRPGADLVAELQQHANWLDDGDVLVITSKIISKMEGRLVPVPAGDPEQREVLRQQAIRDETVRVVARRGSLVIAETRHGLVLAAAGVDASNVDSAEIALLPENPDASATALRADILQRMGRRVAVIISDSMGRPWRHGISDVAIGVAGITAVVDERGSVDRHGNVLSVTEVSLADEIAAAGDLVKGKLSDIPIAVVRGLSYTDDGNGSRLLLRGSATDLFRTGTAEAIALGRAQAAPEQDQLASQAVAGLHADVLATLNAMPLDPADGTGQAAIREGFHALLAARPDATRRACLPGHITASTVLLDNTARKVLLTLHPRVGAWLQLGGHCEDDDTTLISAAAREALEESGIPGIVLDPNPVDLDVHPITCSLGQPTRHFDVRFVGRTPAGATAVISEESDDLRWFDLDALPDNIAPELPHLIRRAAERSRA